MKRFLICFIGIDGSGKTTLCKSLTNELKNRGVPSRYVYGRFLPKITAPVFKVLSPFMIKKNTRIVTKNAQNSMKGNNILKNQIISYIYITGVLFDQILQILLKVCLPSLFKKEEIVVCDRWFFDTALLDIGVPCGYDNKRIIRFIQRFLPLFPKAHLVFLVVVPPKIAEKRKKDLWQVTELQKLQHSYLSIGKAFGAICIDGTKNLMELKSTLLNYLKALMIILPKDIKSE